MKPAIWIFSLISAATMTHWIDYRDLRTAGNAFLQMEDAMGSFILEKAANR